jgi:hypothetical protein
MDKPSYFVLIFGGSTLTTVIVTVAWLVYERFKSHIDDGYSRAEKSEERCYRLP